MAEPHDVELDEEPEAMVAVMLPLPPPHQVENILAIPASGDYVGTCIGQELLVF
jgi:hypothetical protein